MFKTQSPPATEHFLWLRVINIFLTRIEELLNNDCVLLLLSTMLTQDMGFSEPPPKKNSLNVDIVFLQASEDSIICLR